MRDVEYISLEMKAGELFGGGMLGEASRHRHLKGGVRPGVCWGWPLAGPPYEFVLRFWTPL